MGPGTLSGDKSRVFPQGVGAAEEVKIVGGCGKDDGDAACHSVTRRVEGRV